MLAGAVPSSEYLIETVLVSTATPSVTFSNLDQFAGVYRHLQIIYTAASSRASSTADPMIIKLNSTKNVRAHHLYGTGSSVGSGTVTDSYSTLMAIAGADAATNAFGAGVIDILDSYSASKNKTIRSFSGAANYSVSLDSALYTLGSITTIELSTFSTTNFKVGSRFSLYGVTA
jgi:hypothetical protein